MKNIVSQGGINDWSRPDHGRSYAVGQSRLLNLFQMSSAERVLCFSAFQYLAKLLLSFCTSGCTTLSATRARLYRFGQLCALHLCFWADLSPAVPLYQLTRARMYRFGQLGALHLCFWADLHPTVPLYQLTPARLYRFGQLCALHLCFWADLSPAVPLYQPHAPGCTVSDNCVRCTSAFGQILVRLYHFINSHAPGCTVF